MGFSIYHPFIIHLSSSYPQVIIHISSSYHPGIIQLSPFIGLSSIPPNWLDPHDLGSISDQQMPTAGQQVFLILLLKQWIQDDTRWCKMMQDNARWCKMMKDDASRVNVSWKELQTQTDSKLHQVRISCLTEKRAACCKPEMPQQLVKSRGCQHPETAATIRILFQPMWIPSGNFTTLLNMAQSKCREFSHSRWWFPIAM